MKIYKKTCLTLILIFSVVAAIFSGAASVPVCAETNDYILFVGETDDLYCMISSEDPIKENEYEFAYNSVSSSNKKIAVTKTDSKSAYVTGKSAGTCTLDFKFEVWNDDFTVSRCFYIKKKIRVVDQDLTIKQVSLYKGYLGNVTYKVTNHTPYDIDYLVYRVKLVDKNGQNILTEDVPVYGLEGKKSAYFTEYYNCDQYELDLSKCTAKLIPSKTRYKSCEHNYYIMGSDGYDDPGHIANTRTNITSHLKTEIESTYQGKYDYESSCVNFTVSLDSKKYVSGYYSYTSINVVFYDKDDNIVDSRWNIYYWPSKTGRYCYKSYANFDHCKIYVRGFNSEDKISDIMLN